MPFKVIQTIENGKTVLTAVPSQWEENNVLYWPNNKSKIRALLQQEFSTPNKEKWESVPCVIKREGCKSILDAENKIDLMEQVSDTEDDETHKQNQKITAVGTTSNIPDFNQRINEEVPQFGNATTINSIGTSSSDSSEKDNLPNQKPASLLQSNEKFIVFLGENINNWGNTDNDTDNPIGMLKQVILNQNTIISQQAKLQTALDTLASLIQANASTSTIEKVKDEPAFQLIDCVEKFDEFEQMLGNQSFLQKIVSNMSLICGKSGKSNGIDSCYMLIDCFLTRQFVSECSWTGQTKQNEQKKIPLKFYKNFRNCFFKIIVLADKDFSETECDNFFKRVLKNSLARKSQKYTSRHKRRPTNLNYRKKHTEELKMGEILQNNDVPQDNSDRRKLRKSRNN